MADWQNGLENICLLAIRDILQIKHTNSLKVKEQKIDHASNNQKGTGVTTLVSNKINFKIKIVTRYKEKYHTMLGEKTILHT